MESKEQLTEAREVLKEKIEDIEIAMLITEEPDGDLRSRPMSTSEMDEDGCLWFFTSEYSPKVNEISQDHKVNLSYAKPDKNLYVSVSGEAELVKDQNKIEERWNPILKAWFPQGLEDPKLALLKITPRQAEYWDASSSKMINFYHIAKAVVKGEKYEGGDNKKLNF